MSDNITINAGSGGATTRSKDKGGVQAPVSIIDVGGAGAESLLTAGQAVMASSVPVSIASDQSAVPVTVGAGSAVIGHVVVDSMPDVTISGSGLALESGGNLAALTGKDFATQTTLAALNTKTPALGQALAAASVPVVLPAATVTTLTPPAAITGFALETGGNLATIAGKDFATQTTLAALNTKVTACNTGAVTISTALPAGTNVIGHVIVDTAPTTAVTGTFWQATQPVSGTVTANAGTGTMAVSAASLPLPSGASSETTLSTLNGKVTACNTGAVVVSGALPAGTALVGDVGLAPRTSGGATPYSLISAATTNATVVKASAGQVYGYSVFNNTATNKFVRLYDKSTTPSGSDTPVRRIMVPANGGVERVAPVGIQFTSGISFTVTGALADNDATAVAVGDVFLNIDWK